MALVEDNIQLCNYDYQPKNGYYEIPDRPGIGQELSEYTMKKSPMIVTVK
jgi:L-alanine-DL-glutamate epimerase-like enolase superfamily enzyme